MEDKDLEFFVKIYRENNLSIFREVFYRWFKSAPLKLEKMCWKAGLTCFDIRKIFKDYSLISSWELADWLLYYRWFWKSMNANETTRREFKVEPQKWPIYADDLKYIKFIDMISLIYFPRGKINDDGVIRDFDYLDYKVAACNIWDNFFVFDAKGVFHCKDVNKIKAFLNYDDTKNGEKNDIQNILETPYFFEDSTGKIELTFDEKVLIINYIKHLECTITSQAFQVGVERYAKGYIKDKNRSRNLWRD